MLRGFVRASRMKHMRIVICLSCLADCVTRLWSCPTAALQQQLAPHTQAQNALLQLLCTKMTRYAVDRSVLWDQLYSEHMAQLLCMSGLLRRTAHQIGKQPNHAWQPKELCQQKQWFWLLHEKFPCKGCALVLESGKLHLDQCEHMDHCK